MTMRVTLPSQASQPGAGGGDLRAEPGACRRRAGARGRPGRRAAMVTTTCGLTVRRIGASPAARALSAQLHQRVGRLLGAGAHVTGGPVGLHASPPARPATFSPPTASSSNAAGDAAVGVPGDRQRPALGGVGFGAVGVQRGPGSGAPPAQLARAAGSPPTSASAASTSARSTPCSAAAARCSGAGDRGDHRHLLGGDHPVGERGRHRRQVLQRPAVADQLPGRARATAGRARAARTASSSARRARAPG